jgi:hypothetical protein
MVWYNPGYGGRYYLRHVHLQPYRRYVLSKLALSILFLVFPYATVSGMAIKVGRCNHIYNCSQVSGVITLCITNAIIHTNSLSGRGVILATIEACWLTFPSTVNSSLALLASHVMLITGVWRSDLADYEMPQWLKEHVE